MATLDEQRFFTLNKRYKYRFFCKGKQMPTRTEKNTNPCAACSQNHDACDTKKPARPNKFETWVHKILKSTPFGCNGESWRCFLKSKHMFLYGASALVFFAIGNTTSAIFERKIQDWIFPDKPAENPERPKSAYHPQTQQYFKIKAVIRNMDTGENTAILESVPPSAQLPQKITSKQVPTSLQNFGTPRSL